MVYSIGVMMTSTRFPLCIAGDIYVTILQSFNSKIYQGTQLFLLDFVFYQFHHTNCISTTQLLTLSSLIW